MVSLALEPMSVLAVLKVMHAMVQCIYEPE